VRCQLCHGEVVRLGPLGNLIHTLCRQCGGLDSFVVEPHTCLTCNEKCEPTPDLPDLPDGCSDDRLHHWQL